MTPSEDIRGVVTRDMSPGAWVAAGMLIVAIGAIVTVATGDVGWVVVASVPGGVMIWVGVIAKGVQVGLRAARREE